MEREENEHRKDLTPSEKVELAKRIEEALAGRHGGDRKSNQAVHLNSLIEKGNSRDIAAKSVDMTPATYHRAKAVVDSGNQEVIQSMDSGEKSIHAAYNSIKKDKDNKKQEHTEQESVKQIHPRIRTFKITLYKNPEDDAEALLTKGGHDYCTKLAIAILKAAGVAPSLVL